MSKVTVVGNTVVDILFDLPRKYLHRELHGEALALPFGSKLPADSYVIEAGGSGANVAVGLKRLGLTTKFISGVSNDTLGDYLKSRLGKEELDLSLTTDKDPTPLSIVLRVGSDRTIITAHARNYDYLKQELPTFGWIHVGPLSETEDNFYQKLLSHAVKNDLSYSLNPSIDAINERGRNFITLLRTAKVLFVNLEEGIRLSRLTAKSEPKDILVALHRLGPTIVCLTAGDKGAYVYDGETILNARALMHHFDEVDATGAGDSFTAAFLASYIESKQDGRERLDEALRYGIVNSASVVAHVGAQPGLLTADKIVKDLKAVTVKGLA